MAFYQQGDVLLFANAIIPKTAKPLNHKRLAVGETTGHAHVAVAEDATLYVAPDGSLYLHAPTSTVIEHPEHKPITVPTGDYLVLRVMEYDPFAAEAKRMRNVRD